MFLFWFGLGFVCYCFMVFGFWVFLVYNRNQRETMPHLVAKKVVSELRVGVEEGDDILQNG